MKNNRFLTHYNRELNHIRHLSSEFAKANPAIARNLRMSAESIEDPHVSRLIEAFAYLNANTQLKLEDDFSEINQALLSTLYPHYTQAIPAMAIYEFEPESNLKKSHQLMKGSLLETQPTRQQQVCRFQVSYDTWVSPLALHQAKYESHCQHAPSHPQARQANACLKLTLEGLDSKADMRESLKHPLRLHLKGQSQLTYNLYELLLNDALAMALVVDGQYNQPVLLPQYDVQAVGFEPEEAILPFSKQSFEGYRLLTEFFCFPEKFLFVDLPAFGGVLDAPCQSLEVFIYFRSAQLELERNVGKHLFALNCAPVINLFPKTAEPIQFQPGQGEYAVVPDAGRSDDYETHSILEVRAVNARGEDIVLAPFYSLYKLDHRYHWVAHQRLRGTTDKLSLGTDTYLNFINLDQNDISLGKWAFYTATLCFNRNLPRFLPFGGGQPELHFVDQNAPVKTISCLTAPTPTLRPELDEHRPWEFISHLNLNYLSLTHREEGLPALKQILHLHNVGASEENRAMIEALISLDMRPASTRSPDGQLNAFCTGTEILLEFDQERFSGSSVYLFASILERFFSLYCSINSFTKLTALTKGKKKLIKSWQPRTGNKTLL